MSWEQARRTLEVVIERMTNPGHGLEWLSRLEKADCGDGRRLGYCIAIDVESGAIAPEDYANVLEGMDNRVTCPRKAFGEALARHPRRKDLVCASRLRRTGTERYVRILSMREFITFYKKDRSLAPDDVAAVREEYFSEHVPKDLSDIRECWGGTNGLVWVMSRDEYDGLASIYTGDALASLLNDRLGLGKEQSKGDNDGRDLVGVRYPDHSPGTASQPTALDAYWIAFGWYYVSYKEHDGWGRTVSCSGDYEPLRERVHLELERLTADYLGFPIGRILYRRRDRLRLLAYADSTLESILASPAPD